MLGTEDSPSSDTSEKQEKGRNRRPGRLRPRRPGAPTRHHAPVPDPQAGRPEAGPVILPPGRGPPQARDRSGALLPGAAPRSPHQRSALSFPSQVAAAPRPRSRSVQAARVLDVQGGRLPPLRLQRVHPPAPGPYRGSAASTARSSESSAAATDPVSRRPELPPRPAAASTKAPRRRLERSACRDME